MITKATIRAQGDEFVAEGVDERATHVASTSGSTGEPLRVFQSADRRRRAAAESMYFGSIAGYNFGTPLFYLKIWTDRNSRGKLANYARNVVPIEISQFDSNAARSLLRSLNSSVRHRSIVAYASVFDTLARVVDEEPKLAAPLKGRIAAIIGQSEPLGDDARRILAASFGTTPVSRYGLEEVGIVAQQRATHDKRLWLNRATHVVEILGLTSDEPAAPGDLGRIVVTDLFNSAQPMVRYDTGDLGVADPETMDAGEPRALLTLDGRSVEQLYDSEDRPIASLISYNFWWKYPDVLQYQIAQTGKGTYILRIDAKPGFDGDIAMVRDLKRFVGQNTAVTIERTKDGFVRASGKRRSVVSNYTPPNSATERDTDD